MSAGFPLHPDALRGLPGAELVLAGLDALVALGVNNGGCESARAVGGSQAPAERTATASAPEFPIEALLVAIGARRLRRAGVYVLRDFARSTDNQVSAPAACGAPVCTCPKFRACLSSPNSRCMKPWRGATRRTRTPATTRLSAGW